MKNKYDNIILVDTENIGESIINKLKYIDKNSLVVLVYTKNSFKARLSIGDIQEIKNWEFDLETVEIKNGTPNALDFCLCSELGYRIKTNESDNYTIISNDTGYRPVVFMWRDRGVNVRLLGSVELIGKSLEHYIIQGELAKNLTSPKIISEDEVRDILDNIENKFKIKQDKPSDIKIEDCKKEEPNKEKIEQMNKEMAHFVEESKNKYADKERDKSLEELEYSLLSDKEYNKKMLNIYVGEFSDNREALLVSIIQKYKVYYDADIKIREHIKRNVDTITERIEQNWDKFRHD